MEVGGISMGVVHPSLCIGTVYVCVCVCLSVSERDSNSRLGHSASLF